MARCGWLAGLAILFAGCAREQAPGPPVDTALVADIGRIRAIDNHAHPVRVTGKGEAPDRGFDTLPVDNMEPGTDPLFLRPDAPGLSEAWRELFGKGDLQAKQKAREERMAPQPDAYPAWVLDRMGVEVMLANRVAMGPGLPSARFRWVPYADALIFPLDNTALAVNSDRKAFFGLEDILRKRYLNESGLAALPATLDAYLKTVVTPVLERHRKGGAVAEKFEAAYLRALDFDPADQAAAERIYQQFHAGRAPAQAEYKPLQDFLFRYIAAECGRLGMVVHLHTEAGAGSYFDVGGANPLHLEPVLNDPALRKTKFVMVHGGWPFQNEITALLTKPNAYLDISSQDLLFPPAALAARLREWLEWTPEKVLFGTDAYPYSDGLGWEESGWLAANRARQALAIALTAMMRDGEIDRTRAVTLARMVLRDNARALYGW
jgi:hypothetical protein